MSTKFSIGQIVWVVERNEDGEACDVGGFIFLAEVDDFAICSPGISGAKSVEKIMEYHAEETRLSYDADIPVFPISDCYPTHGAANAALDREAEP